MLLSYRSHKSVIFTIWFTISLFGCHRNVDTKPSTASAEARVKWVPIKPVADPRSYVLVTQGRPESVENLFPLERAHYKQCAEKLQSQSRLVKPFPVLPGNFVLKSETYVSDLKRKSRTYVWHTLQESENFVDTGCEVRLRRTWIRSIIANGIERSAGQVDDGEIQLDADKPANEAGFPLSEIAKFATPKVVNKIALKCNPSGACIVDPHIVWIEYNSLPVKVVDKYKSVVSYNTSLIIEPVSLVVDKPVPEKMFSLQKLD